MKKKHQKGELIMTEEEREELEQLQLEQLRYEKELRDEEERQQRSKQLDNKIIGITLALCAVIFLIVIAGIMIDIKVTF